MISTPHQTQIKEKPDTSFAAAPAFEFDPVPVPVLALVPVTAPVAHLSQQLDLSPINQDSLNVNAQHLRNKASMCYRYPQSDVHIPAILRAEAHWRFFPIS